VLPVERLGFDPKNAITRRVALDISGKTPPPLERSMPGKTAEADSGELIWRMLGKDRGALELRGAKTKAVVGRADNRRIDLGHGVEVRVGRTRAEWCTISLALLEGESFARNPRRALLVAAGIAENTAMGWKDESRSTVGRDWGRPPSLVEPVAAAVRLPRGAARPVLYPLDDRGRRGRAVAAEAVDPGTAQFTLGPPHKTIWYEIDYAGGD
jgi:hypothetical protein